MSGQTGTGAATTAHNPITDLKAGIRGAGSNARARNKACLSGMIGQCQAAANEGLPAVQLWLKNYNSQGQRLILDTMEEGAKE